MAADFIGLKVHLKLKPPHNYELTGLITDVRDQKLFLAGVHFPKSNQYLPSAQFLGTDVADIEVIHTPPTNVQHPELSAQQSLQTVPNGRQPMSPVSDASMARTKSWQHTGLTPSSLPPQPKPKKPLQDPAILSFSRSPAPAAPLPLGIPPTTLQQPVPVSSAGTSSTPQLDQTVELSAIRPEPAPITTRLPLAADSLNDKRSNDKVSATLSTPFSALNLDDTFEDEATPDATPTVAATQLESRVDNVPDYQADTNDVDTKSKTRRGRRGNRRKKKESDIQDQANGQDSSPEIKRPQLSVTGNKKGSGWRETPIIQEPEPKQKKPTNSVPGLIGGKVGRQAASASAKKSRRQRALEATSGWATEDVSDIQEMGDFDFEANFAQFDKKAVFEELRRGDTTADEDRLVAINRPQGRGALGISKNLRHDENVLERPRISSREQDLTNDESELDPRAIPSRKQVLRKPSDGAPHMEYSRSTSSRDAVRSSRTLSHAKYSSSHAAGSPRIRSSIATPPSPVTVTRSKRSSLRYTATNRVCPAISPSTLAVIENLAFTEHLLTDETLDENAAHSIVTTVTSYLRSSSNTSNTSGRRSVTTTRAPHRPVIVLLIGDHKGGARALAAARHLLDRSFECVAVISAWQNDDLLHFAALHPRVGTQIRRFAAVANGGYGRICTWADASRYLKTLEAPPELIIDALAPLLASNSTNPDANWNRDPIATLMAAWANRSKAEVLAIDIPSGVDSVTGDVEVVEGEPAEIRAQVVVCGGAPTVGLVRALELRGEEWTVVVGDTGVGPAWKVLVEKQGENGDGSRTRSKSKGSEGRRVGVDFGEGWSVEVRFDSRGD